MEPKFSTTQPTGKLERKIYFIIYAGNNKIKPLGHPRLKMKIHYVKNYYNHINFFPYKVSYKKKTLTLTQWELN